MWVFKVEDLSSSRSEPLLVRMRGEWKEDGMLLLRWLSVLKWEIVGVLEPDCRPWQRIALREVLCRENCEAQLQQESGEWEVHPWWLEAGPRKESHEDWTTLLTSRAKAYCRRVWASLEFQMEDGGLFKCEEDHSDSWECFPWNFNWGKLAKELKRNY